jgi:hypothetical protein
LPLAIEKNDVQDGIFYVFAKSYRVFRYDLGAVPQAWMRASYSPYLQVTKWQRMAQISLLFMIHFPLKETAFQQH